MLASWQGPVFAALAVIAVCAAAFETPLQKRTCRGRRTTCCWTRGRKWRACQDKPARSAVHRPRKAATQLPNVTCVLCRRLAGDDWQHNDAPEGAAQAARPGWAAILGSADFRAVAVVRSQSIGNKVDRSHEAVQLGWALDPKP